MAITNINLNPSPEKGIDYTVTTDTSADWAGVANDTYFYDFGDKLPHYKNASGDILEVFSEGSTPVDVLGIADSDGVYTYYSDYASAITAVSVGGTIEQFGDIVETGSVVVAITKSLNINMNGHSYTLDNVDGTHAFTVSGAAADLVKISNGIISRKNGTGRTLQIITSSSTDTVDLTGTIITNENNNNWLLVGLTGHIIGGTYIGTNGIAIESSAKFSNFTYEGSGILQVKGTAIATKGYVNSSNATYAVTLGDSTAVVSFLEVKATVNVGIWSIGDIHNCNIEAVGYGVYSYGSDSKVTGTHAYSSGSLAFYLDAGQIINCEGYSDGNSALLIQGGATNGTMAKGCYFMSSAKYAIWIGNNGANLYDCYGESTLNTTAGHGIGFTSNAVSKIVNCELVVTNAGANALNGTASGYVTGLVPIGMTTAISSSFTITQDDTHIVSNLVQHATQTAIGDTDLIEDSINFHMDGSALAGRYKDNLGVVTDIQFGAATSGPISVTDSSGVPTFYTNLAVGYSNAVAGDVVKLHTDIEETGAVSITMINDVTLDLNGYTYTHSGNADVITYDNATASTFHVIKNGNVTKTAGTGILFREAYGIAPTNHLLNVVFSNEVGQCINANGNFVCTGSKFYANDSGLQGNFFSTANARVDGGEYYNVHATGGNYTTADVYNTRWEAYGSGKGVQLNGSDAYSSKGYSVSGIGLAGSSSNITDCYGFSDSDTGLNNATIGTILRCTGISNSNKGINATGGDLIHCIGISKGSQSGIYLTSNVKSVVSSYSESESSNGISTGAHDVEIKNCVIRVNSGSGHGIQNNGFRNRVYNCTITVASSSAYGIVSGAADGYFTGNKIKGTVAGTKGIYFTTGTNLWTDTADAQGNSANL